MTGRSSLELATLFNWKSWGYSYALFTACCGCDEMKHCRGRKRGHVLCLDCFDQGAEGLKAW